MTLTKYIACICEGAAGEAIINILMDANKLIFKREDLLDEKPLRCRSAQKFEQQYLGKGFTEKITVIRILDSRREKFKLSKAYAEKIEVINIITAPEIEMLVIHSEGKFNEYTKSSKKPSEFCVDDLQIRNVKSQDFINSYFSNIDKLISALNEYKSKAKIPKGEYCFADLLK